MNLLPCCGRNTKIDLREMSPRISGGGVKGLQDAPTLPMTVLGLPHSTHSRMNQKTPKSVPQQHNEMYCKTTRYVFGKKHKLYVEKLPSWTAFPKKVPNTSCLYPTKPLLTPSEETPTLFFGEKTHMLCPSMLHLCTPPPHPFLHPFFPPPCYISISIPFHLQKLLLQPSDGGCVQLVRMRVRPPRHKKYCGPPPPPLPCWYRISAF